jgi:predicted metalloprotease with PDZ domain
MYGKKGDAQFKKIVRHWRSSANRIGKGGSIYLANYLGFYRDQDSIDRIYLLYNKGPLVLHALRQELGKRLGEAKGDQAFFTLLRSFMTNFAYRWGATAHIIGILNQITRDDWQPWFEKYVFGTETPKVKI